MGGAGIVDIIHDGIPCLTLESWLIPVTLDPSVSCCGCPYTISG